MAKIKLLENESIEDALKRFKIQVTKDDIMQSLKFHQYHMTRNEKKIEKAKIRAAKAKKRRRK